MGNVTRSQSQNIKSPEGNSLAVFVDGNDDVMKIKDVRGNVQDLNDYIPQTPVSENAYLYAYSSQTQVITTDSSKINLENLELNQNINLTDDNTISFSQEGIYNFNLSFQAKGTSISEIFVNILKNDDDVLPYSEKAYNSLKDNNVFIYNTTLNIVGTENLSFQISANIIGNGLSSSESIPSATLTINKIG
jgi:hypothetical protein